MLAMTGRIILGTFIIIAVGLFIAIKFDVEKIPPPPQRIKQNIEVTLPHRIDVENDKWGVSNDDYWHPYNDKWSRFNDNSLHTYKLISEECNVKIYLPSGQFLSYEAINADLIQIDEILSRVYLRLPPLTSDYQESINNLESELRKLSVDKSQECISGLDKLRLVEKTDPHTSGEFGCFSEIEKGIELQAGVKTILSDLEMKWITYLEFSSTEKQ